MIQQWKIPPQVMEQLHGDGGEGAAVFYGLFPPRVTHQYELFPEGYDAMYEKGRPRRVMALLVLVFIHC
jgi:hypothetical protein